ncbi:hypothetical protein Daus18300_012428 [Diaporthe australafricana]|uniref:Uncharacterized protein n=1 Tax=Diaporthe australafricana TaxID=127596 RepID=A0ABR3W2Y5_9PEZI
MARKTTPDNSTVYVAFRGVFRGKAAKYRQLRPIKELVDKVKHRPQVAQLLQRYGAHAIHEKIWLLLAHGKFESTGEEPTFSDLVEVSSAPSTVPEAEAPAGHANSVGNATDSDGSDDSSYYSDRESGESGTDEQDTALIRLPTKRNITPPRFRGLFLLPPEFDFGIGHRILRKTQDTLELACFRFAEKAMPQILKKRNWHCPESAELNLWMKEFWKRKKKFKELSSFDTVSPSSPLEKLFKSIKKIRHDAVHRGRITALELWRFMFDSETLALLLGDGPAVYAMYRATSKVQKAATKMQKKKDVLEARLSNIFQGTNDKQKVIGDAHREYKEYQLHFSIHLEQSIWADDEAMKFEMAPPGR